VEARHRVDVFERGEPEPRHVEALA
jgi:hypothetical protein